MLWNPRRIFRDALFAWGSLLVAIPGASLLYAILVVNQAPETIQIALPFGAMLAFLVSVYPPTLKLYKKAWSRLQKQAVELWLERDSWEVRWLVWLLALMVVFLLKLVNEGALSAMQMLLFLPLLFTSLLVAAQWMDLIIEILWDGQENEKRKRQEFEEKEERKKKWKMRSLLVSVGLVCLPLMSAIASWEPQSRWGWALLAKAVLWGPQSRWGWALLAKAVLMVFVQPFVISLFLLICLMIFLIYGLARWDWEQAKRLLQVVERVRVLLQEFAEKGERKERMRLRRALAQNLVLALGIVLALAVTLPILILAFGLKEKIES